MHNLSDFTNAGGLWLTQDVLNKMQESYAQVIDGISGHFGDKCIVSGAVDNNGVIGAGWVVYQGEILPFTGGMNTGLVDIDIKTDDEQYDDGTTKPFYTKKSLIFVSIATATSFPYAELLRPGQFKDVWLKGDTKAVMCDTAYILANFDPVTGIGLPTGERSGWRIVYEMGGRVMVGYTNVTVNPADNVWDDKYNTMGAVGGEKLHKLIESEMAAHRHSITGSAQTNFGGAGWVPGVSGSGVESAGNTNMSGGDVPHENRPPFKVYLFIEKL